MDAKDYPVEQEELAARKARKAEKSRQILTEEEHKFTREQRDIVYARLQKKFDKINLEDI